MRGVGGKRKVVLNSEDAERFNLRKGSLVLENVELEGLEFVTGGATSSVVFAGNASASIGKDSALNFDVEGITNELILTEDAVELSGSIAFLGNAVSNRLKIRFSLTEPVSGSTGRREGVDKGYPVLILSGNPGIFLTSDDGFGEEIVNNRAELVFGDNRIAIRNKNENAFIIDNNSLLKIRKLQVLTNPIKQQSSNFEFILEKIFGEGIDSSFIRKNKKRFTPKTAFARLRMLERLNKGKVKPRKNKSKKNKKKKKKKKRMTTRGFEQFGEDTLFRSPAFRSKDVPIEPDLYDIIYRNEAEITDPEGNLEFNGGDSSRFKILSIGSNMFDIYVENAHIIMPTDAVLTTDQVFRFEGDENIVNVRGIFEFGAENFDLKDSVIFKGDRVGQIDPTIKIKDLSILTLSQSTFLGTTIPFELGNQSELSLYSGGDTTLQPTARFYDGGILRPSSDALDTYVSGEGKLVWDRGSLVATDGNIFLTPNSTDILACTFNNSTIRVEDSKMIATGLGTSSWALRDSRLIIEEGGTFAFNDVSSPVVRSLLGSELRRGYIEDLTINGNSQIHIGGKLVLGRNKIKDLYTAIERTFNCKWEPLNISGDGLIEYVDRSAADIGSYKGFVAKLQTPAVAAINDSEMTFEKLAILLSQKTSDFTESGFLHYEDENGSEFVRTNKGNRITLAEGDTPVQVTTNAAGKYIVIIRKASGASVAYDEDGNSV